MGTQKENSRFLKLYEGYGHTGNLVMYGHVLERKPFSRKRLSRNPLVNILQLIKLFIVKPVPEACVRLYWREQVIEAETGRDGFVKFEWESATHIAAGWHEVKVQVVENGGSDILAEQTGKFFVPHVTQFAFISDIDDTVLISHSASIFRRLRTIFTKNPHTRRTFNGVIKHYQLLAEAHADSDLKNPFFYVSSSEWNLYNDLKEFFRYQGLPEGIFLLSSLKRWFQLLKSGQTRHGGKGVRIARIMDVFPQQRFVLLGDNSQQDPEIYSSIALKYPNKIFAIYIRNIRPSKKQEAVEFIDKVKDQNTHTLVFENNEDAIAHSRKIGLI